MTNGWIKYIFNDSAPIKQHRRIKKELDEKHLEIYFAIINIQIADVILVKIGNP